MQKGEDGSHINKAAGIFLARIQDVEGQVTIIDARLAAWPWQMDRAGLKDSERMQGEKIARWQSNNELASGITCVWAEVKSIKERLDKVDMRIIGKFFSRMAFFLKNAKHWQDGSSGLIGL